MRNYIILNSLREIIKEVLEDMLRVERNNYLEGG